MRRGLRQQSDSARDGALSLLCSALRNGLQSSIRRDFGAPPLLTSRSAGAAKLLQQLK
jgi:hypothetical protein